MTSDRLRFGILNCCLVPLGVFAIGGGLELGFSESDPEELFVGLDELS